MHAIGTGRWVGALLAMLAIGIGVATLHAADKPPKAIKNPAAKRSATKNAPAKESADVGTAEIDPAAEVDVNGLVETLQKSVGSPVNVELKSGTSFVRATLLRVSFDRKRALIRTLGLQDADTGKTHNIGFASVRSIRLDRETIYTAPEGKPRSAAERRASIQAEQAAELRSEWVERAKKNGVEPWPELTKEEHAAAVEEHRKLMDEVGQALPGMQLYETHEFLFFSNIPASQIAPYTAALDAMHDMMCHMYGIKRGEPVWKGKCLVMAFLNKAEFIHFEQTYLKNDDPSGAYGFCHSSGDGRVIISCYRGDRPADFAKMLVHETSHGFIHRYRTSVHPPSWINEGMADWIAARLVPSSRSVAYRESKALQTMRQTGSMGGGFFKPGGNIEGWQYGVASSLTSFLIAQDSAAYTRFIQGIKEGLSWQDSLKEHYNATPEEMIAGYGRSIGVSNLRE